MKFIPYTKRSHADISADVAAAQAGDEQARNRVIQHNLRLVVKHAHAFAVQVGRMDLLDDLIQAATFGECGDRPGRRGGLLRAIETYDPRHGTKFTTHARSWIRLELRHALSRAGALKKDTVMRRMRITRVRQDLMGELGRQPTHDEIRGGFASRGWSVERVTDAAIDRAIGNVGATISFDALTEPSEDAGAPSLRRGSIEADPAALTEDAIADRLDNGLDVERALQCLTEQERITIVNLFGIGRPEVAAPALAKAKGVSRQRISFIRQTALKKMRSALEQPHGNAA